MLLATQQAADISTSQYISALLALCVLPSVPTCSMDGSNPCLPTNSFSEECVLLDESVHTEQALEFKHLEPQEV